MRGFNKIIKWQENFSRDISLKQNMNSISFNEIKEYLSGFARVINYRHDIENKNFYVTSMLEGQMKNGLMQGYATCFEVKNSGGMQNNNVNSQLSLHIKNGFWTALKEVSVPHGKFWWKNLSNGKEICAPGIWFGLQDKY
jgi:hypothetical protein